MLHELPGAITLFFSPHPPLELVAWRSAVAEGVGVGESLIIDVPLDAIKLSQEQLLLRRSQRGAEV